MTTAASKKVSSADSMVDRAGERHQKAVALNAGADDYVVKPFHPEALIARV